MIFSDLEICTR